MKQNKKPNNNKGSAASGGGHNQRSARSREGKGGKPFTKPSAAEGEQLAESTPTIVKDKPQASASVDEDGSRVSNSGTSSAERNNNVSLANMLVHTEPGIIIDPISQQAYSTRRARPYPSDELQYYFSVWRFDMKGYHDMVLPTGGAELLPAFVGLTESQMDKMYPYMYQAAKIAKLPRWSRDTISAGAMLKYANVYHNAVALAVTLLSIVQLPRYNDAFQQLAGFLIDRVSHVASQYVALQSIIVPDLWKQQAFEDGLLAMGSVNIAPHFRFWSTRNLSYYGGATNYVTNSIINDGSVSPITKFGTVANIDLMIVELAKMVGALEGVVVNNGDATANNDVFAIREAMAAAFNNPLLKPHYSQGLPDIARIPGVVPSNQLLNDWYARCFTAIDSNGTGASEVFPIGEETALLTGRQIPIFGWGKPGVKEFTLFGAIKWCHVLENVAAVQFYATLSNNKNRFMGCSMPEGTNASPTYTTYNDAHIYTREDGNIALTRGPIDWNDGTACRTAVNSGDPLYNRHLFATMRFAQQLNTYTEFRFLDQGVKDFEMWRQVTDYPLNHARYIMESAGLPLLT